MLFVKKKVATDTFKTFNVSLLPSAVRKVVGDVKKVRLWPKVEETQKIVDGILWSLNLGFRVC